MQDLKEQLQKLKMGSSNTASDSKEKDNSGLNLESFNNVNKEMQANKDLINKTNEELDKLRKELAIMKDKLNKVIEDHSK